VPVIELTDVILKVVRSSDRPVPCDAAVTIVSLNGTAGRPVTDVRTSDPDPAMYGNARGIEIPGATFIKDN
jgi:hypothetical protein